MMLYTKYETCRPCVFRQEYLKQCILKTFVLTPHPQPTSFFYNFVRGKPIIIPIEYY